VSSQEITTAFIAELGNGVLQDLHSNSHRESDRHKISKKEINSFARDFDKNFENLKKLGSVGLKDVNLTVQEDVLPPPEVGVPSALRDPFAGYDALCGDPASENEHLNHLLKQVRKLLCLFDECSL